MIILHPKPYRYLKLRVPKLISEQRIKIYIQKLKEKTLKVLNVNFDMVESKIKRIKSCIIQDLILIN
ncbi:hypothetical protein C4N18_04170 [Fusobacterium varium ATCC 27725]|jgi:hypothetical protein|uniref:Uncharacterized protein n=1 Tax=Fusobacterium varium ATCC 27725 TaxID=469618 RepID=A0ABM6U2D1_FUSVA|nr:hypothetical protein C4N18_04170 [Fusobacterium varium ATCC 27725]